MMISSLLKAVVITLLGVGGIAGQLPIGWLADRVDRMLLAAISTLLVSATSLAMPFVVSHYPWNYLYMFIFGAILSGIYTIALVIIGDQFKGADLAAASALFGLMWGAGSVLGPQIGGLAYDYLPRHGLPLSIAMMSAALVPVAFGSWLRQRRAAGIDRVQP
jgi:MFS family permease